MSPTNQKDVYTDFYLLESPARPFISSPGTPQSLVLPDYGGDTQLEQREQPGSYDSQPPSPLTETSSSCLSTDSDERIRPITPAGIIIDSYNT
jgi:hypothetical protein